MIQINQCTKDDIERLPGIGPATAQKLIASRPIKDVAQLEELIPPSAWLKVQGVEFGFEVPEAPPGVLKLANKELSDEEVARLKELWEEAMMGKARDPVKIPIIFGEPSTTYVPVDPPIILQDQTPLTLRRVMPRQPLRRGGKYLCLWNMRWGPAGEAVRPQDAAIQIEVETRLLEKYDISVMFAHYAASVRVQTDSYGQVPVLFFEIIEETQDDSEAENTDGADQGSG